MSDIRLYPDPVLMQVAVEATPGPDMDALFEKMILTMQEEGGIGLAAPQVGVSVRAIVVKDDYEIHRLLNPKIIFRNGLKIPTDERCLSVPGLTRRMHRDQRVRVRGQDQTGKTVVVDAKNMLAACFQHECDHLEGLTIATRRD